LPRPLDPPVQQFMANRFGSDCSQARVHDDIAVRDVPGGHKFDVTVRPRNRCENLELMLKNTPPRRRQP
jgi:Domain of unknown function (DUF4157)